MLFYNHNTVHNPGDGQQLIANAISLTQAATTQVLVYAPPRPVRAVRWGFVAAANVTGNNLVLSFDLNPTAGSVAGQVVGASTVIAAQSGWNAPNLPPVLFDAAGGTISLAATLNAGQVAYHEVAPQKPSATYSPYYPDPDVAFDSPGGVNAQFVIYPGQSGSMTIRTAATAGTGFMFLEVEELGFQGNASNYPRLITGIPAGITPTPSDPGTLNRFLS